MAASCEAATGHLRATCAELLSSAHVYHTRFHGHGVFGPVVPRRADWSMAGPEAIAIDMNYHKRGNGFIGIVTGCLPTSVRHSLQMRSFQSMSIGTTIQIQHPLVPAESSQSIACPILYRV